MERNFLENTRLELKSNGNITEFTINRVKGVGGSCIAYEVSFYENGGILHRGILKEFCPAYLEDGFRRNNTEIIIPEDDTECFKNGLSDFRETYRLINEYIANNASASNYHPVQLGLFEGNNTLYTLSSCDYGKTYDQLSDDSLYSLIKLTLAAAKGMEQYHKAGFLHLDIKPKNILVLDNITDLIKLFDYDSLIKIDDLKSGRIGGIPSPEDYYVPELDDMNIRNIGIHTDIFEIGSMLFTRLFGRAPQLEDMGYDCEYDFDSAPLLNSESPKAIFEIEKLLKNTLQISVRRRYKSDSQLITQLENILSLVDNKKSYLINLPIWQPSKLCIERKDELVELNRRLEKDGYVFIKGMGGLGKSELAKMFVKEYGDRFHTIQFYKYVDSLKSMTASMPVSGINDEDYDNTDELAKVKNKILHQSDSHTLIIVDNFNVTYDKYLREFLPSYNNGFKVIFTTRCMPAADYYEDKVLKLPPLSFEDSQRLFYMHSEIERSFETDDMLEKMINEIQFNTLLLILIAKTVKRTKMQISEIVEKLREQELDSINTEVFYEYDYSDDDIEVYNKINSHLNTVFNISGLSYEQQKALLNMTLVSAYGIKKDEFLNACKADTITPETIESLINQGWLDIRDNLILVHSIVSDIVAQKDIEKHNGYYDLAEYLENTCNVDESFHIAELQKALAVAKQLERRYKTNEEMSLVCISYLLCGIYLALYRPKDAKKYIDRALETAQNEKDYDDIPYIYNKLGEYEEKFGIRSNAIDYYNKVIDSASETEGDFSGVISDALVGIAESYENDNQKEKALDEYIKLFNLRLDNGINEYVHEIIKKIIALCEELGDEDKLSYYQSLSEKFICDDTQDEDECEITDKINQGDYDKAQAEYEQLLFEMREELGEDSPYYKDTAKYRWVYFLINGNKEQAMRLIAENMSFIGSTYGKNSMEMADFLSMAAFQLVDKSEFDTALEMAQRAIDICRMNNQEDTYTALMANMDLMVIYVSKGDSYTAYDIAENLDFEKYSGNDFLSDIIRCVGMVLVNLSMYDEAKNMAHRTLNSNGINRISIIIACEILIICYEQEGDINKAEYYLHLVSDEINSLNTLKFVKDLLLIYKRMEAKIFYRKGDFKSAIESLDYAISLYENKRAFILLACYQDRGVYFTCIDEYDKAKEDFDCCEEIIRVFGLSDKMYLLLYNNIALIYFNKKEYQEAEEYYNKVFNIKPDIKNPENYTEALICQNYGWVEYNLENAEVAEEYIKRAMACYEQKETVDSDEYILAKYNLSVIYSNKNDYENALPLLIDLYKSIDKLQKSGYAERIYICTGIIKGLLLSDKAQQAYDFASCEDKYFAEKYGKKSIQRIDYLQQTAGSFKLCGYTDAFEFLERSRKQIKKAGLENSIWQASQYNYAGVFYLDLYQENQTAKDYFERAKALLESLSFTEDPLYTLVENNLQFVNDKILDEVIQDMAKIMIEEEGDN